MGARLAERLNPGEIRIRYQSAAEIMDEMAQVIPLYANATHHELDSGARVPLDGLGPTKAERQTLSPVAVENGAGFLLTATRSLFTSYEGAAIQSPQSDRLHREESVALNPADAASLGVAEGDMVTLRNPHGALRIKAHLTNAVAVKTVHMPLYYDGGAVSQLFDVDAPVAGVEIARA
jgi:predicted molibdopterin-dependent oxidoreductase YjgC